MSRAFATFAVLLSSTTAYAAADLDVRLFAPASAGVYETVRYEVTVKNVGNRTASGVELEVALPQTNTSPTVHVMGVLGAVDARCAVEDTRLVCDLGKLRKRKSATIDFELALPTSLADAEIVAIASTDSREKERGNNEDAAVVALEFVDTAVAGPVAAVNRHCTGIDLLGFHECVLSPTSISSHGITLLADGDVAFDNAPVGYTGSWSQPADDQVFVEYRFGGQVVSSYLGHGVGGDCFEGVAEFAGSSYVSPRELCLIP